MRSLLSMGGNLALSVEQRAQYLVLGLHNADAEGEVLASSDHFDGFFDAVAACIGNYFGGDDALRTLHRRAIGGIVRGGPQALLGEAQSKRIFAYGFFIFLIALILDLIGESFINGFFPDLWPA